MNISGLQAAPPEQVAAGEAYLLWRGRLFAAATWCEGRGASTGRTCPPSRRAPPAPEMERWLDNPTSLMGIKSLPICPGWAFCPDFQWAIRTSR